MSIRPSAAGPINIPTKEQRDVGNFHPLRHQSGHGADGKNKPGRHQRVFGDFDRGRLFQLFPPQSAPNLAATIA